LELGVSADDGLLVVASHVVPLDAVIVQVVQDGQAGLINVVLLEKNVVLFGKLKKLGFYFKIYVYSKLLQ
jgi:hypothetical protein